MGPRRASTWAPRRPGRRCSSIPARARSCRPSPRAAPTTSGSPASGTGASARAVSPRHRSPSRCAAAIRRGARSTSTTRSERGTCVVTIADDAAPAIVAGEALPSGWRRDGSIPLSFTGSDAVGVYELELKLDGDVLASAVRGGCYEPAVNTLARPCVGSPTVASTLDVASLADGAHELRVRAVDPAGNAGERVVPVLVDHTPPVAPQGLTLEGGDVWRARGAVNVSWTNPPQPGVARDRGGGATSSAPPRIRCFDEVRLRIGLSGRARTSRISPTSRFRAPVRGRIRIALRDAAGNVDLDRVGTLTETLRFDPGAPSVSFVAGRSAGPDEDRRLSRPTTSRASAASRSRPAAGATRPGGALSVSRRRHAVHRRDRR